jgi:hypothetical protein
MFSPKASDDPIKRYASVLVKRPRLTPVAHENFAEEHDEHDEQDHARTATSHASPSRITSVITMASSRSLSVATMSFSGGPISRSHGCLKVCHKNRKPTPNVHMRFLGIDRDQSTRIIYREPPEAPVTRSHLVHSRCIHRFIAVTRTHATSRIQRRTPCLLYDQRFAVL